MRSGSTLVQLAEKLHAQQATKRDFIADTRSLHLGSVPDTAGRLTLSLPTNGHDEAFPVTRHAHGQIAARLQIPKPYYDRMLENEPDLLASNVNRWLNANPEKRLVRTLGGNARAFLSNRYRRLDNFDLAETVLPILDEKGMKVVSCELTDTRLYIKALAPKLEREVKRGDVVQAGVTIRNSEIGSGALAVEMLIYRLICSNGMTAPGAGTRKAHLGRATDTEAEQLYTDRTLRADDRAFWLKVQDTVRASADEAQFNRVVEEMAEAQEWEIRGDPTKAVEALSNRYSLTNGERGGVLNHLISGGDLSKFGLLNAVTRMSQDVESYDRATELEDIGGRVLALSKTDWEAAALN